MCFKDLQSHMTLEAKNLLSNVINKVHMILITTVPSKLVHGNMKFKMISMIDLTSTYLKKLRVDHLFQAEPRTREPFHSHWKCLDLLS